MPPIPNGDQEQPQQNPPIGNSDVLTAPSNGSIPPNNGQISVSDLFGTTTSSDGVTNGNDPLVGVGSGNIDEVATGDSPLDVGDVSHTQLQMDLSLALAEVFQRRYDLNFAVADLLAAKQSYEEVGGFMDNFLTPILLGQLEDLDTLAKYGPEGVLSFSARASEGLDTLELNLRKGISTSRDVKVGDLKTKGQEAWMEVLREKQARPRHRRRRRL
jgi:hypothetical protein